MVLANVMLVWLGGWVDGNLAMLAAESDSTEAYWRSVADLCRWTGAFFAVVNLVFPFLPKRPWIYLLHLANILAAILLCFPAPLAIPALILWLKQDTREFFDMR